MAGLQLGRQARAATGRRFMPAKGVVGISKTKSAKPARVTIPTEDRTDNSFSKLLKAAGHVRTKDQPRTIEFQVKWLVHYLGQLTCDEHLPAETPAMFVLDLVTVLEWLTAINSQENVNRRDYPQNFKASLKALCSDDGLSFIHNAAVAAGLFTKPATKPVYNSLSEAVEEIGRLRRIIKEKDAIIEEKDAIIKDRDAEIEELMNGLCDSLASTNLDAQDDGEDGSSFTTEDTDGDLDEEGSSFPTEDTGFSPLLLMGALMEE